MARDANNQFIGKMNQGVVDFGIVTLGSDGTIAVPLCLGRLKSMVVSYQGTVGGALSVSTLTTTGSVTVTSATGSGDSGKTVSYIAVGFQ